MCQCKEEYATLNLGDKGELPVASDGVGVCTYERKSRTTAILYTVFLNGTGAGAWYLGWTGYGGILIAMCLINCCCGGAAKYINKGGDVKPHGVIAGILGCIGGCAMIGLFITLLVWISGSECVDSNGVECY